MHNETLDLGSWFILRMASSETLKVAAALEKRGFEVWTPVRKTLGKPRKDGEDNEIKHAVTPGYVFASFQQYPELQKLADVPTSDTPRFTVFRVEGSGKRSGVDGIPLISGVQLEALHHHEAKLQRQYDAAIAKSKEPPKFDKGHTAPIRGGGFDGLEATVLEQRGRYVLVDIPGFNMPIEVSALLLAGDDVCAENPKAQLRHRNRRAA